MHITNSATDAEVALSTGGTCTVTNSTVPESCELSAWQLVAENWEAPSNISDVTAPIVLFNTTNDLLSLLPWVEIPALVNTSGIGYYTSTFDWSIGGA